MKLLNSIGARGLHLGIISATDYGTPLIRMIIISHLLNLHEMGVASALAATYSTFELITDIAIYRFVFSSPREEYQDALAAAHALSVTRGLIVASLALVLAPVVTHLFSLDGQGAAFTWLPLIILIRSFEHLEPKVAERDYRYSGQLIGSVAANLLSLSALAASAYFHPTHDVVIVSLLTQVTIIVLVSHCVAKTPYRLAFGSPNMTKAWNFGYPLMFNGIGLALAGQGDRLLIGGLMGVNVLAVYTIPTLVANLPAGVLFRFIGTIGFAAIRNAEGRAAKLNHRLKIFALIIATLAAIYFLGLVGLMNTVDALVFGARFQVAQSVVVLLALGACFKVLRTEPFTSLFLSQSRTPQLAIATQVPSIGLGIAAVLIVMTHSLEGALVGRFSGEVLGFFAVLMLAKSDILPIARSFRTSVLTNLAAVAVGGLIAVLFSDGRLGARLAMLALVFLVVLTMNGVRLARMRNSPPDAPV